VLLDRNDRPVSTTVHKSMVSKKPCCNTLRLIRDVRICATESPRARLISDDCLSEQPMALLQTLYFIPCLGQEITDFLLQTVPHVDGVKWRVTFSMSTYGCATHTQVAQ
jgi:hypothetical protein